MLEAFIEDRMLNYGILFLPQTSTCRYKKNVDQGVNRVSTKCQLNTSDDHGVNQDVDWDADGVSTEDIDQHSTTKWMS